MLATVSARSLNVRAIPDIAGTVLGVLAGDTVVSVNGTHGVWMEIQFKDSIGFVAEAFVDPITDATHLQGRVETNVLNVRDLPSLSGRVVGTLTAGSGVTVLSQHLDWLEVEFNNNAGFVCGKYVSLYSPSEPYVAEVLADALNVRARPDLEAPLLGQVMAGKWLNVECTHGDWCEIVFNGSRAYVSGAYLRQVEPDDDESRVPVAADRDNDSGSVVMESALRRRQ